MIISKIFSRPRVYGISRWKASTVFVFFMMICGIVLLFLYSYYLITHFLGVSKHLRFDKEPKIVWIYAKKNCHLKQVIRVFSYAGYTVITSLQQPNRWDVMWAYDYPFKEHLKDSLMNLRYNQMVNHLPGTGFITLKVELAKIKLSWIPKAFSIPDELSQFMLEAEKYPEKLWVQKSNNHRGIRIVSKNEIDTSSGGTTFVQEFIQNPLLIDGRKFDIGVYVVVTSVDPLIAYIYENDFLVRFCTQDYNPFNVHILEKYVVGDQYVSLDQMESLSNFFQLGSMGFKDSLFLYLQSAGYDVTQVWKEIKKSIASVLLSKAAQMAKAFMHYSTQHNFFELMRVDYVIDKDGKVWLMEFNMSPNLSPTMHPINTLMFQQVVYNTLSLVGVLSNIDNSPDTKDVLSSDRNIVINDQNCLSTECLSNCNLEKCVLCYQCLTQKRKEVLKKAYKEHHNRGVFTRVLPYPMNPSDGEPMKHFTDIIRNEDIFLVKWFKKKCLSLRDWYVGIYHCSQCC